MLLRRQLESIREQSHRDWRCHVGIDGSNAGAARLIHEIIGDDDRFVVHEYENNVGFYRNFERIIRQIDPRVEWFALADQDDYWYPDKLSLLVAELGVETTMAASGQARIVDSEGGTLGFSNRRDVSLAGLMFDNQVTGSLAMFRTSVLATALPFPAPTHAAYHDHWLGVVASSAGRVTFLADIVQDYVQHDSNVLGEEQDLRVLGRLMRLRNRATNDEPILRYLAVHRWNWRVRMARRILASNADRDRLAAVIPIADGRISWRLLWLAAGLCLAGEVSPLRATGLLAGSLAWRRQDIEEDTTS
ncbi:hypothetical protein B2K11_04125 [Microbacterium sp. B35-30]|nr:hypothetical protein B2K11_04125 [Microbacterium sp. B35-30]